MTMAAIDVDALTEEIVATAVAIYGSDRQAAAILAKSRYLSNRYHNADLRRAFEDGVTSAAQDLMNILRNEGGPENTWSSVDLVEIVTQWLDSYGIDMSDAHAAEGESPGCTCCQVRSRTLWPDADNECSRCGHLAKSHTGAGLRPHGKPVPVTRPEIRTQNKKESQR